MKNFARYVKKLQKARRKHPEQVTLLVGRGDAAWRVMYCQQSGHYYVMSMASGDAITSGASAIRKAFRIDSKTYQTEIAIESVSPSQEKKKVAVRPRVFAVKVFSGACQQNKLQAENETEALGQHQFAEMIIGDDGQPMIISEFYQGVMLCDPTGKPNKALLEGLDLTDRLQLIQAIVSQYAEIHTEKNNKQRWLHVDIKGSNIIVDNGHTKNAWVIDFGSAKKITGDDVLPTGLSGLTLNVIPPEAIKSRTVRQVSLHDETGTLSTKSDVYALGPVLAILLGAENPYGNRGEGAKIYDAENGSMRIDLAHLNAQVEAGFNFSDLLSHHVLKFPGNLQIAVECGFINGFEREAPNDATLLAIVREAPCSLYMLFKDQLLYVDKNNNKVVNRKRHKLRAFQASVEKIKDIKTNFNLSPHDYYEISCLLELKSGGNLKSLHDVVAPLIKRFIDQMVDLDEANRPSMNEALQFFKRVYKIALLAKAENELISSKTQRDMTAMLLELNLILDKAWQVSFALTEIKGETPLIEAPTIEYFDFDTIKSDEIMLEQLGGLFHQRERDDISAALTEEELPFINLKSEGSKIFEAILIKVLGKLKADTKEEKKIKRNIYRKVGELVADQPENSVLLHSLPASLLRYLFSDEHAEQLDLLAFDAWMAHEIFIQRHFPEKFESLQHQITPIKEIYLTVGSAFITKNEEAQPAQDKQVIFKTLCAVRASDPIKNNPKLYTALTYRLSVEVTEDIHDYLRGIAHLKNATYQRYSFFGLFGHTVGEKRYAAEKLIQAIHTGNYDVVLSDKKVFSALTHRKLGKICQPLIDEMVKNKNQMNVRH